MIIFGTRERKTGTAVVEGHSCTHCGTRESLFVQANTAYFHIFWIPVFPYSRKIYSVCTHCRECLRLKAMPPDLSLRAAEAGRGIKTPWYYFSGLILLGAFFLISAIAGIIT